MKATHPDKQKLREYMDRRTHEAEPPPTPDEIREQLGWRMLPNNDDVDVSGS